MPGKPAARLTDMTAHGGMITGPGVPTVLIGKMPAATMGDMHMCPMVTPAVPPIPHVGGPIMLGSTGVFIGKKPAARMGDMAICVGPPSSIILGCMTVMIGEVGSGSQAGPAPSAAAATSAKLTGVKAVKAIPPPEWKETKTENHVVDVLVHDKKNLPLAGLCYKLKDPNGVEIKGATTQAGKIHHEGYAKAGSYEVQILSLANAKWSSAKIELGKTVEMSVDADGIDDGTPLVFHITAEIDDKLKVWVAAIPASVQSKKAKAEWTPTEADIEHLMQGHVGEVTGVTFLAVCVHAAAASGKLEIEAEHVYTFRDPKGKPYAEKDVEIETKSGKIEAKKTDKDGKVDLGKGRVGAHRIGKETSSSKAAPLAKRKLPLSSKTRSFDTLEQAARVACKLAQTMTRKTNFEYGGWLYQRQEDSKFSFTGPMEGKVDAKGRAYVSPGPEPVGEVVVMGTFHSHPHRDGVDNNQFSNNEGISDTSEAKAWTQKFGTDVYMALGCPNGKILGMIMPYVDPRSKTEIQTPVPWSKL